MSQEIISVQCTGANPESLLPNPVNITVDADTSGNRRVGCPYLLAYEVNAWAQQSYFCQATKEGLGDVKNFLEKSFTEQGKDLPEDYNRSVAVNLARKTYPQCIHKNPA